MHDEPKLRTPTRADLVHAISQAMLWRGKKRLHHWDRLNAQVAAENLIDNLGRSNFVILQVPPGKSQAETEGARERAPPGSVYDPSVTSDD